MVTANTAGVKKLVSLALLIIALLFPGSVVLSRPFPSFMLVSSVVRGVARPASGIEQGLDDGEFLLDTSITAVPACHTQDGPAAAFDGTNFLVVWHDGRDNDATADIYGARVSQSGTVLDPAGIPISTAAGSQFNAAVSFDGTNFLVVWGDNRGVARTDVYGARVSPSGAVLDTNGIPISTAAYDQDCPALSFDGTNYLVVWTDHRNDNDDIYGARVSPSGAVLDPQGVAICDTMRPQGYPAVSFDGTNYLVAWWDSRNASPNIYGARVNQSGTVLDPQGLAVCDTAVGRGRPAVSFDGTNYLVVWADRRDTGEYTPDIYGARVAQSGTVLDPDGLPICAADRSQGSPAVSFDGANYLVTWADGDIHGARVSQSGTVLDSLGFAISAATDQQGSPAVSFGGTNHLVVWNDGRSPSGWSDIYGARVNQAGSVLDPEGVPIATSAHWQWSPAVSSDGTDFLAVWEDYRYDPDTSCIYGTRVSQSGTVLDPQGFAISTAASFQPSPAASFDGTNYLTVWRDSRNEQHGDIYGARVSQSGTVLDPQGIAISTARSFQWSPAVSSDGTSFLVMWEDARNDAGDIYGARVSSEGEVLDPDGIPVSTAEREQFNAAVSFDGTNFLVVWGDQRGRTRTDIYGARVSPSGAVIDTAGILISATSRWLRSPVLSFDGTNHLVVWTGSNNLFDTIYDIHVARVSPAGVVLDTSGITLSTAEYPRPYPAVAFDGTDHLVMWERERNVSPCIYRVRVTPQGIPFDSGTVVTGLHGSGGEGFLWPALLALARGAEDSVFLVYASRALTVGGKAYNAQRIWGKMNPALGIEEEPGAEVRRVERGATVVRGVLFLAGRPSPGTSCLLDVSGRKVLGLKPGANDVSGLAPGVYFLSQKDSRGQRSQGPGRKILIQR